MAAKCNIVQVSVLLLVTTVVSSTWAFTTAADVGVSSITPTAATQAQVGDSTYILEQLVPRFLSPISENTTMSLLESWANEDDGQDAEGRSRKKKYKKHEIMMLTKMLMGLKVALLGVVLPLAVLAAKLLSWKAVTLSLLAFMLAKIVFVKNLVMGKSAPTSSPPTAPAAPIIIHSPPSHSHSESLWKRASQPRIHLQPEVHVHHSEEHHAPSPPTWTWAEETRASKEPHHLAYAAWAPKTKST